MSDTEKDNKVNAGLRILPADLAKLKYMAWYDRASFTDTVLDAVESHIAKWEKKNGPITPEQIEQSLSKNKRKSKA
jgi:hypothetical protein